MASSQLVPLAAQAREFLSQVKAWNTRRAYAADCGDFAAWCGARGFAPLTATPETMTLYLSELAATPQSQHPRADMVTMCRPGCSESRVTDDATGKAATDRAGSC
jgi:hypothetical protein